MTDAACTEHLHACTCIYMHLHACICMDQSAVLVFQLQSGICDSRASTRFVSCSSHLLLWPADPYRYIPVDTRAVPISSRSQVDVHSLQPAPKNNSGCRASPPFCFCVALVGVWRCLEMPGDAWRCFARFCLASSASDPNRLMSDENPSNHHAPSSN